MRRTIAAVASFALFALSGCGDMALRNLIVDIVTRASVTALEAPSGLSASSLSVSQIHLSWTDNSSTETGFKIERSPDGSSGWTQVRQSAANETACDDSALTINTAYFYRVRAASDGGDSAYSNTTLASTMFAAMTTIDAAGDSFTMGDGTYGPGVSQTLSYSFAILKREITNAQFAQFIGDGGYSIQSYWTTNGWNYRQSQGWAQPAYWLDSNFNGANQPVVGVSWYEAVAFSNWRSGKEGLPPAYDSAGRATLGASGYRLPTEVEWEYTAAKGAGPWTERMYAWGSTWDESKAVCKVAPATAAKTADVGSKSPAGDTPQGISDMSGNVEEWCSDNVQSDGGITIGTDRYYFLNDSTSQTFHYRGGAWYGTVEYLFRCAHRFELGSPFVRTSTIGFRVVRP